MKILHVISSLPKTGGGTSEIIPKICAEQVRVGLDVAIAYRDVGSLSDSAREAETVGVRLVSFNAAAFPLSRISFSSGMMRGLGALVKEADVVHVHGGWLFAVWWAVHCARKYHKPYVMMPHGSLEPERLKISKWKKRIVGWLFDRRAYKHAAAAWVTAESEIAGVRRYGATCPIAVMPLGLDVRPYEESHRDEALLARLGISKDKNILLYLSRITKFKGLDMLAKVWKDISPRFPDWQLVVTGPDDYHGYRSEIEAQFNALCSKRSFVFTGPVYGADKFNLIKSASGFVLPTRNENFSIAVAEALASGVPVVCTKGAPWKAIAGDDEIGRSGWWVEVSEEGIREGLQRIFQASEEDRKIWGQNGGELVRSRFAWPQIAQKMKIAYAECLNERA